MHILHLLPSRKARQVIVMHCRPPFVYMYVCIYVYMYICISVPVNPRHLDCAIARCSPAGAHDNKMLYLATIGHETAQHSTAPCVQIVVNVAHCFSEGYTPVGHSAILADVICPAWPGTFSLFTRVKRITSTVLAQQGRASLRSSKYVGVDCPAAIQCFVWLAIPSF